MYYSLHLVACVLLYVVSEAAGFVLIITTRSETHSFSFLRETRRKKGTNKNTTIYVCMLCIVLTSLLAVAHKVSNNL